MSSKLSSVIADVSESLYSHVGLVVKNGGELQVLEAIGPVKFTTLDDWITQGDENGITVRRLKNPNPALIARAIAAAKAYLGKPYDLQYEWSNNKIYCSELTYKAFRTAGIEIGKKQTLGELNWQPHRLYIIYLAGGILPLDRVMVTPESQMRDDDLVTIYSNIEDVPVDVVTTPPSTPVPSNHAKTNPPTLPLPSISTGALMTGTWEGDYASSSLSGINLLQLVFASDGTFKSGHIIAGTETYPIVAVNIIKRNGDAIEASLQDSRGISAKIQAMIVNKRKAMLGSWVDSLKYKGVFSLSRLP